MRLNITDVNFTTNYQWIYKLIDESGNHFYIMDDSFYKRHDLKNPITKKELDYFDRKVWIDASVMKINNTDVIISIS